MNPRSANQRLVAPLSERPAIQFLLFRRIDRNPRVCGPICAVPAENLVALTENLNANVRSPGEASSDGFGAGA